MEKKNRGWWNPQNIFEAMEEEAKRSEKKTK